MHVKMFCVIFKDTKCNPPLGVRNAYLKHFSIFKQNSSKLL